MSYKSYLSLIVTASLLVLFIIPATNSFAEIKIFEKEIEETVGKNQSQEQVEAFALQKAKRLAVEEAGTYISSLTIIKNYKLAKDEITALASGIVKAKIVGIPSVSLKNGNIHIRVKSRIQVDTSILDRQIEAIMKEKGTLKKLEKERRKVKELENKLANIKSTELKRLDEINKQAIVLEIERDKQRVFREEQRLKARGDIAKAELDILKQEKERIARFEKMRKEQENARIKELEDIAKEKDRIKKAQLENERYWKELARNAEISRTNWIQIDDSLSLKQAIEEADNLITEIYELNKKIDLQFKSSNKNLEEAYKQQIAATRVLLPPDPSPKDAFETTTDYKKRLADHKNKVRESKTAYQHKIKNLEYERNLKNEQVKMMLLKQKIKIIGPFILRLKELRAKRYVLPDEKIAVSLGDPDADNSRFPTYIEYRNRKWTKYWNYQNRKEAEAFWKTRSHLNAQAIFQLVNTENNKVSHSITAVKINHLGTKEERLFELEPPEEFYAIEEFEDIQTTQLPEAEEKEKFLAIAPQRDMIKGIWETSAGRMIEVNETSGTYIFMGTKDVRKRRDVKRFLNKITWDNIRHVDNNLWSCKVIFRVKAPVTRRPPHRPVREDFPHTVPRFRPFLPSRQPIRRHPDWRITLLPIGKSNIIVNYSG